MKKIKYCGTCYNYLENEKEDFQILCECSKTKNYVEPLLTAEDLNCNHYKPELFK